MKRRIGTASLLLIFFALTTLNFNNAQAQTKTGAKGGIGFTNFYNGQGSTDSRTGFRIGGFVKMNFPESPLAIQPEIYYAQKGAQSGSSEVTLNYIEAPILFKLQLGSSDVVKPNLFAGPYAAFNLDSQQSSGLFNDPSNDPETIDFGGTVGAGLDFEAGKSIFTLDVRYTFGLTPVYSSGDAKNSGVAIVAGISLPDSKAN